MNDNDFDNAIQAALDANKTQLMVNYNKGIGSLQALTDAQLSSILPDSSASDTLNQLISVVQQASVANLQQADLTNKITALGQNAVKIAKLAGVIV
jgi:hypothetical protein